MPSLPGSVVVLGGGVAGLTTALELHTKFPNIKITLVAKFLPGDVAQTEYCSPQAGANWISFESEWNQFAWYDKVSFERFLRIADEFPESGVERFPFRLVHGPESDVSKKPWFEHLVGGTKPTPQEELPPGAAWGVELTTFMFNSRLYLTWLLQRLLKAKAQVVRRSYNHIDQLISDFPTATAVFNCTGLGAKTLGGVEDQKMYATKGHTLLIGEPKKPIKKMYVWSQPSLFPENEFSHVFPRPLGGGIIIGGVRLDDDHDETLDPARTERIKQRACQLCPDLGRPDDLQVISQNVGLRPSRIGGARVESEQRKGVQLIHNYGAGGAGYQSSWGMATHAVSLFEKTELDFAPKL